MCRVQLIAAGLLVLLVGCGGRGGSGDAGDGGEAWDASGVAAEDWEADLAVLEDVLRSSPGFLAAAGPGFADSVTALRRAIPELPPHRILAGFARLAALGGDGHTEIWLLHPGSPFRRLPVSFRWFSDGPRVTFAHPADREIVGGRLLRVGTMSADSALEAVGRFLSADNGMELLYTGPVYLRTPEILEAAGVTSSIDGARIEVETAAGATEALELAAVDPDTVDTSDWISARDLGSERRPLYERRMTTDLYWFEHLTDSNTLYLQVNRSRDAAEGEDLAAFTERFLGEADRIRPDRLVVDLRHNVGGNFRLTERLAEGIGGRPHLSEEGRLFVILSRQTFSAGVMFAVQLRRAAEPLLVGEVARGDPNGSYDVDVVRLPRSRVELEYTTELHRPVPEIEHRDHLPLDVEIPQTYDDWVSGRDPVMEWILGGATEAPVALRGR